MIRSKEAVPASVRRLLERLAEAGVFKDFYLAGGTGLALLLSHRRSVDLDLFSPTNRLDLEGRRGLLNRLKSFPAWKTVEEKDGTLHGGIGNVWISFFWYPDPLVRPLIRRGKVRIASLEDIGLMKTGALIGRGSRKDFVDLYAISRRIPLSSLFALGQKKFTKSRDFTLQALKALCFFDDAEKEPPVVPLKSLSWRSVKAFFIHKAATISKQLFQGI